MFMIPISSTMNRYHDKRRRIDYIRIKHMLNLETSGSNSNNTSRSGAAGGAAGGGGGADSAEGAARGKKTTETNGKKGASKKLGKEMENILGGMNLSSFKFDNASEAVRQHPPRNGSATAAGASSSSARLMAFVTAGGVRA
jgi:hypothetical protein